MVNEVCWTGWVHNIEEVHMLMETCETKGGKETPGRYDSAGEAQAWAGSACVETRPSVAPEERVFVS